MRTRRWFGLALGLIASLAFALILGVGKMPAQPDQPKAKGEAKGEQPPGKGKRAQEFIAAFNKGDAKAVAGFWTPTGDYVDQIGRQFKGRAAIEKLYEKVFAGQKGAKLSITVTSRKEVTPDVVMEDGITEVTPADGGPSTSARFAAVLVKQGDNWFIESVRESVDHPPSNAEHFEDLEWLLGDWTGESRKGESGTASYDWAENRNFIICTFTTTLNDIPVVGGTQWIAWDAIDKEVRSWSFYSGGGFGEATWTKNGGNKWLLKTTARTAGGQKVSATNVLTRVDDNHLTFQMTKLTVDGKSIPDPSPLKLKRVNGKEP